MFKKISTGIPFSRLLCFWSLLLGSLLFGQTDLVIWNDLTSPTPEVANITTNPIVTNNVTLENYGYSGYLIKNLHNGINSNINYTKYLEFRITPASNYKILLSQFKLKYNSPSGDSGPTKLQVRYSTDSSFPSNGTLLGSEQTLTKGSEQNISLSFPTNYTVNTTLYLRVYLFGAPSIYYTNFFIRNTVFSASTPGPAITGTVKSAAPPIAVNDPGATTAENISANIDILANDTYSTLSAIIPTSASHGTVTVNGLTDVTYTPNSNYTGSDSFTYTITDENGTSNSATVNITISAPTPPTAVADAISLIKNNNKSFNVLANDTPGSGAFDYVTKVSEPSHGIATINPDNKTFTYTPTTDFTGIDSFQYNVTNVQDLTSNTVTVNINVYPSNDLARWNNINFTPSYGVSHIIASNITAAGGVSLSHVANGNTTNLFQTGNWPTPQDNGGGINTSKFVEFTISPDTGYKIELDRFNFNYKAQGTPQNFRVRYSKDNFATSYTMIGETAVPTSWTSASNAFSSVSPVMPGDTVKIRIYAYNTNNNFLIKRLFDTNDQNNFSQTPRITGQVMSLNETDLAITNMVVNNSTPTVGDNVIFTINVKNNGQNDDTSVKVNDLLPNGYQYVSNTPSVGTYNNGTGVWTIGNFVNGNTASIQITAKILGTGSYNNTASIAGDSFDPILANNTVDVSITPYFPSADLEITNMSIDNPTPLVGQNVTFTINTKNNGPDTAPNVEVSALLPSGYQYVSNTPSVGTYNSGTGVWAIGSFANGSTANIQITAKVLATGAYNYNTSIAGAVTDPTPANNTANANITNTVDLQITKAAAPATPGIGDPVTFTIEAENLSTTNGATNVVVKDVIPAGYNYVNSTGGSTYDSGTKTVTWNVGNLAALGTASFTINTTAKASGNHTNTAAISAAQPDDVPANNTASATVTPDLGNGVDLVSSAPVDLDTADYGTTVTFNITAGNTGPNTATNGTMNILLANGFQYISATTGNGGTVNFSGVDANGETRGTWTMGATLPALSNPYLETDPLFPGWIPISETLTITAKVLSPEEVAAAYNGRESAYIVVADLSASEINFDTDLINNRAYSVVKPPSLPPVVVADLAIAEGAILTQDFGSGTSTFGPSLPEGTTNLNYFAPNPIPGTYPNNYVGDNFYTIGHNPYDAFDQWRPLADGSGVENGYYYIGNANYDPREFFRFHIDLTTGEFCANTRYVVRFKAADVNPDYSNNPEIDYITPEIGYFIQNNDGVILGAGIQELPNQPGELGDELEWNEYAFVFTTNNEDTSVDLVMFNNHPGGYGNDLAIDDITVNAFMTPPVRLDMEITETEIQQQEVCGGEDVKLFVTVSDPSDPGYIFPPSSWTGVDYQWQKKQLDGTWANIGAQGYVPTPTNPGDAINITYEIPNFQPEDQAYYRLLYSQPGNLGSENCRFISNQLLPLFNATPVIPPIKVQNDGPSYICGPDIPNGTIQLYTDYDTSAYVDNVGNSTWGTDFYLWESSNPTIATIDQTGLVTALSTGTTTIKYTVWSPKGTCTSFGTKVISVLENCPTCIEDPADTTTDGVTSPLGISTLKEQLTGWPENIPNGNIVLQSKNKGFVITRVANDAAIADPKEGMLVYNIADKCIKLYNGSEWHCIAQDCNNP